MQPTGDKIKRFREFSLPELMEEAIRDFSQQWNYWEDPNEKEFINDFLTQKGIL